MNTPSPWSAEQKLRWWLLPLTISVLIGAICPATGALLITQRRVLLANLMAHSVLPGLVVALAIG
ncbi:MAG: hypothetical protein EBU26_18885, partial [Verrucomicrobia bacterium]|nr:hypothetical protein [Verrucomicrobiota bacterium]